MTPWRDLHTFGDKLGYVVGTIITLAFFITMLLVIVAVPVAIYAWIFR